MTESKHNPYAPPKATVDDVAVGPVLQRPNSVVLAMKLLLGSLALSFVTVAFDWEEVAADQMPIVMPVILVVLCCLAAWIYYSIWAGRNWARIVLCVLALVGLPMMFLELQATVQRAPIIAGLDLITTLFDFFALYLLFFPGARAVPAA